MPISPWWKVDYILRSLKQQRKKADEFLEQGSDTTSGRFKTAERMSNDTKDKPSEKEAEKKIKELQTE